jgi:hypothetical protein
MIFGSGDKETPKNKNFTSERKLLDSFESELSNKKE